MTADTKRALTITLACILAALLPVLSPPARAEQPPFTEEDYENGWDSVYINPLPEEDIFVLDKTLPLPEVLKKLSRPTGYVTPEEVIFGDFPLSNNEYVQAYINYFTGSCRGGFKRWLKRSGLYEDMIKHELRKRGMPEELFYLCMIESGFNPRANSTAQAGGLWQFIRQTGRKFGLEINYWVDERYDPKKSTRAALDYLSYLHDYFGGDWHLAAASYNAGEAKIGKEIRKTGCTDYWCLCEKKALKSETRNYLPQMIAAALIGRNPERYGFYNLEILPPLKYSTVTVDDAMDLRVIARCAGATLNEIMQLNPELLQFATPPGVRDYRVNIPEGSLSRFRKEYAALRPEDKQTFKKHKVQKGQSIRSIAAGYQVSSTMLASMNGLSTSSGLREGQLLIVPAPTDAEFNPRLRPIPETRPGPTHKGGKRTIYTVEPGDSLWTIAQMYGVSIDDLKKCNNLKNSTALYYGDTIRICGSSKKVSGNTGSSAWKPAKIEGPTRTITYTVRPGDRCYYIARHYGIHSKNIIGKNKLDPQCSIRPGQQLTLVVPKNAPTTLPPTSDEAASDESCEQPAASSGTGSSGQTSPTAPKGWVKYVVREGDSLWGIAKKHDAHVVDIKKDNNLESDSVKPGQTLIIKPGSEYKGPTSSGAAPSPKPPVTKKPEPAPKPGSSGSAATCKNPITHIVQPGESLWGIARRYDAYSDVIRKMNGLESDALRPGQKLDICPGSEYKPGAAPSPKAAAPAQSPAPTSTKGKKKINYSVKEGDSLWKIARDHDVHVADIKAWNNLDSDSVKPGQTLVIYQ